MDKLANGYIKRPLNYTGGKYKVLPQIIPIFPKGVRTFVDLFGGAGNVGINVSAGRVVYNDKERHIVGLLEYFKTTEIDKVLDEIEQLIDTYALTQENTDGFNRLRQYYNTVDSRPIVLYTLMCYAFNNQIRFNNSGQYNMPFGRGRSSFNPRLKQKLIAFCNRLQNIEVSFTGKDFTDFDFSGLSSTDLVYADPPYLHSVAVYNKGWTEADESCLLERLDELDAKGIRFALSNNLKYDNKELSEWKNKYNIHYLEADYSNCNYHKKDRGKDSEVLITNY